eukprot:13027596-Alexandrium_andersonii.AAC.1
MVSASSSSWPQPAARDPASRWRIAPQRALQPSTPRAGAPASVASTVSEHPNRQLRSAAGSNAAQRGALARPYPTLLCDAPTSPARRCAPRAGARVFVSSHTPRRGSRVQ